MLFNGNPGSQIGRHIWKKMQYFTKSLQHNVINSSGANTAWLVLVSSKWCQNKAHKRLNHDQKWNKFKKTITKTGLFVSVSGCICKKCVNLSQTEARLCEFQDWPRSRQNQSSAKVVCSESKKQQQQRSSDQCLPREWLGAAGPGQVIWRRFH